MRKSQCRRSSSRALATRSGRGRRSRGRRSRPGPSKGRSGHVPPQAVSSSVRPSPRRRRCPALIAGALRRCDDLPGVAPSRLRPRPWQKEGSMKKLAFTTVIEAPRETVWDLMLAPATPRAVDRGVRGGLALRGAPGTRGADPVPGPGPDVSGMVSTIAANRRPAFLSILHLGMVKDGVEDTTNEAGRLGRSARELHVLGEGWRHGARGRARRGTRLRGLHERDVAEGARAPEGDLRGAGRLPSALTPAAKKKRGPSPWTAAERAVLRTLRRVEPVAFAQGLLPGQAHPPRKRLGS